MHNHHEIERQRPAVVEDRKTSACSCADAHVFRAVRLIIGPDVSSPGLDDGNRRLEDIDVPRGVYRGAACMHVTRDPELGNLSQYWNHRWTTVESTITSATLH